MPIIQSKTLDTRLALSCLGKEAPNEIILQSQGIDNIGTVTDLPSVRRIDIAFNSLTTLHGIQQFPQLRHLAAYCCRISDIEDVCGTSRLESLMLQQNDLHTFTSSFTSLNKLRELRVDRNHLTVIENLSSCSSLRVLDLSWNKIITLDGLAGLQSLQELKANNNCIKSLKPLRALPSLKELDVSSNSLRSLEGLQQLPTLECIHAENNAITTVQIPQTYTHQSKLGVSKTVSSSSSTNAAAQSVAEAKSSKKVQGPTRDSKSKKSTSNQNVPNLVTTTSTTTTPTTSSAPKQAPVLGMTFLSEIFLSGNCITSLAGIDRLGMAIELLDISRNLITDIREITDHISGMGGLQKLSEIRLDGNEALKDVNDASLQAVVSLLLTVCPAMTTIDSFSIGIADLVIDPSDAEFPAAVEGLSVHDKADSSSPLAAAAPHTLAHAHTQHIIAPPTPSCFVLKKQHKPHTGFHTWEDDGGSVGGGGSVDGQSELISDTVHEQELSSLRERSRRLMGEDSSDDEDKKQDEEKNDCDLDHNVGRMIPKLHLKNIKTVEEIMEMESVFNSLVLKSKYILGNMSSYFEKLGVDAAGNDDDSKTQEQSKHSASMTSLEAARRVHWGEDDNQQVGLAPSRSKKTQHHATGGGKFAPKLNSTHPSSSYSSVGEVITFKQDHDHTSSTATKASATNAPATPSTPLFTARSEMSDLSLASARHDVHPQISMLKLRQQEKGLTLMSGSRSNQSTPRGQLVNSQSMSSIDIGASRAGSASNSAREPSVGTADSITRDDSITGAQHSSSGIVPIQAASSVVGSGLSRHGTKVKHTVSSMAKTSVVDEDLIGAPFGLTHKTTLGVDCEFDTTALLSLSRQEKNRLSSQSVWSRSSDADDHSHVKTSAGAVVINKTLTTGAPVTVESHVTQNKSKKQDEKELGFSLARLGFDSRFTYSDDQDDHGKAHSARDGMDGSENDNPSSSHILPRSHSDSAVGRLRSAGTALPIVREMDDNAFEDSSEDDNDEDDDDNDPTEDVRTYVDSSTKQRREPEEDTHSPPHSLVRSYSSGSMSTTTTAAAAAGDEQSSLIYRKFRVPGVLSAVESDELTSRVLSLTSPRLSTN